MRGKYLVWWICDQRAAYMQCYIKSQYYLSTTGLRGRTVTTKDKCAICYDDNDLMTSNAIERYGRYTEKKTIICM